jgi:hypothetical protein
MVEDREVYRVFGGKARREGSAREIEEEMGEWDQNGS